MPSEPLHFFDSSKSKEFVSDGEKLTLLQQNIENDDDLVFASTFGSTKKHPAKAPVIEN